MSKRGGAGSEAAERTGVAECVGKRDARGGGALETERGEGEDKECAARVGLAGVAECVGKRDARGGGCDGGGRRVLGGLW